MYFYEVVSMYTLIASYRGPEEKRTFVDKLFRRPGQLEYALDLRLYQQGLSFPIQTVGFFRARIEAGTPEINLQRLEDNVKDIIGDGISIDGAAIPDLIRVASKDITIKLEPQKD